MKKTIKYLALVLSLVLILSVFTLPTLAVIVTQTGSLINTFLSGFEPTGRLVIGKTVRHPFGPNYAVPETNDGLGSSVSEKRGEAPAETEPAEELDIISMQIAPGWDHVPLYFQTDYPYTMYGSGTIESSGCSITSLAMVASYLTEHEYLPDELARYFGGRAENNIARLETGSESLQLPFSKAPNCGTIPMLR